MRPNFSLLFLTFFASTPLAFSLEKEPVPTNPTAIYNCQGQTRYDHGDHYRQLEKKRGLDNNFFRFYQSVEMAAKPKLDAVKAPSRQAAIAMAAKAEKADKKAEKKGNGKHAKAPLAAKPTYSSSEIQRTHIFRAELEKQLVSVNPAKLRESYHAAAMRIFTLEMDHDTMLSFCEKKVRVKNSNQFEIDPTHERATPPSVTAE